MGNKQICKYIWFTHYIQPLKSLGKQYFILHLHNQRQTILKSLENIDKFQNIEQENVFKDIKHSFSESLISISQFLNGCRSIIPDNLLYQISGKLLQCVCNQVVNHVLDRVENSQNPQTSDISIDAAHNISMVIKHIEKFELLSNDLEYMTRDMKIWKSFIKLGHILDKDMSLAELTNQLNHGLLDVFDEQSLINLICALFQQSEKRKTFINDVAKLFDDHSNQ
eukprot:339782_1